MRIKKFTIAFALLCSLAQQPIKAQQHNPTGGAAAPIDWRPMITIAETKRNEQGKLLPLQSYDETIRRGMAFLLKDHLKWLLNGPIKTRDFRGFYEDIPDRKSNRTNYDCLDTIRYLLSNRTDTNGYLETARELNAWVEKVFLDEIKDFKPAEGIREQLACNVVMGIHSLNWASMLLELSEATGDEKMRQRAIQTANYITYYLQPDNRILVGFHYHQWWYSCHTGVVLYLLDFVENRRPLNARQYNPFGETRRANQNSTLNMHLLPKGEFAVGKDKWGDIVRVNMLKIKDWPKVPGVKKAWIMKGYEGEEGMAFHPVISEVKDVDGDGKLLWKRNAPSSLLSKGDWNGDGVEDIACFALGANVDGMFSVWNGKGQRLYAISFLPSPSRRTWSNEHNGGSWSHAMPGGHEGVRRQIDLDGNGFADFIMPFGTWHWGSDSILFLMEGPRK